ALNDPSPSGSEIIFCSNAAQASPPCCGQAKVSAACVKATSKTFTRACFCSLTGRFRSSFRSSVSPDFGSVNRSSRAPLASLTNSISMLLRFAMHPFSSEPVKLQHPVEILRRNFPELLVRLKSCSIKVAFVQLPNCGGCVPYCHCRRLQDFVIKRDRQFALRKTR